MYMNIFSKKQRSFAGETLATISFPLGGIGTGCVGLSGRGGLTDWQIFNRPSIGFSLPKTFPIIWAQEQGKPSVCRVLQAPPCPPYEAGGHGHFSGSGEGLPHMDRCVFHGEFPFAWIAFQSRKLPVSVSLEAYNPFIPSDPDASGYPAAILRYTLKNRTRNRVRATVAWSLFNAVGLIGSAQNDPNLRTTIEFGVGRNVNQYKEEGGVRGLFFSSEKWPEGHPRHGSMALTTPEKSVTVMKYWLRAGWFSPMHEFWDEFSQNGILPDHDYDPTPEGESAAGALGVRLSLSPGQSRTVCFYITWYFPIYEKSWGAKPDPSSGIPVSPSGWPIWKNYYAHQFTDAFDVAVKLNHSEKTLREVTRDFHDSLFSTTAPSVVLDAVSSQIAILKSPTCLRLEDGTFYGFEGCSPCMGCCEGSCTHVWNYQLALPFLFPSLERSMRTADYKYNQREDGSMGFRLQLPIGVPPDTFLPCGDGQMGGIIKLYRDWKISGDDEWLKTLWPAAKRALEYAWVQWDADKDGVMEGIQHNTYDIEFHGPNPLMTIFYLGALTAGSRIAEYLGDKDTAEKYLEIAAKGKKWIEENLFNSKYFVQIYDEEKVSAYQFGKGCLSDQLLGQWLSSASGLGYVISPQKVKKTLQSIFKYNWKQSLAEHPNAQRVYALNNESGLLMCSWPLGERPRIPFPYSDEVWTGTEYQVASHLIWEGFVEEGARIVAGTRARYDGKKRNPWNEFECGFFYARAMAAYGLLLALSGFSFDVGKGRIGFEPRIKSDKFKTFWALDNAWGTYEQEKTFVVLEVHWGKLELRELLSPVFQKLHVPQVILKKNGTSKILRASSNGTSIQLAKPLRLTSGDCITVKK